DLDHANPSELAHHVPDLAYLLLHENAHGRDERRQIAQQRGCRLDGNVPWRLGMEIQPNGIGAGMDRFLKVRRGRDAAHLDANVVAHDTSLPLREVSALFTMTGDTTEKG